MNTVTVANTVGCSDGPLLHPSSDEQQLCDTWNKNVQLISNNSHCLSCISILDLDMVVLVVYKTLVHLNCGLRNTLINFSYSNVYPLLCPRKHPQILNQLTWVIIRKDWSLAFVKMFYKSLKWLNAYLLSVKCQNIDNRWFPCWYSQLHIWCFHTVSEWL